MTNKLILFTAVCSMFLGSFGLFAQDIHFSQFYAPQLVLNPAFTGNFKGDYRISGIYRHQMQAVTKGSYSASGESYAKAPFTTTNGGFDMPLYVGDHKLGLGITVYQDKAGTLDLSGLKAMASLAYHKKKKGHEISVGIQPAYTQRSVGSLDDATTPSSSLDTKNHTGLQSGTGQKEQAGEKPVKYIDFNAGVTWSKKFGKFKPVVGLGLFHIVNPKESVLQDEQNRLPNRQVASLGGRFDLNSSLFFMPNVLFMGHKKAHQLNYGVNVAVKLPNIELLNYVYIGPQYRHSVQNVDAMVVTAGVNLPKWNVGVSRDFTMSNLKTGAPGIVGAWEVSVIYIAPETLLKKTTIPCERY